MHPILCTRFSSSCSLLESLFKYSTAGKWHICYPLFRLSHLFAKKRTYSRCSRTSGPLKITAADCWSAAAGDLRLNRCTSVKRWVWAKACCNINDSPLREPGAKPRDDICQCQTLAPLSLQFGARCSGPAMLGGGETSTAQEHPRSKGGPRWEVF